MTTRATQISPIEAKERFVLCGACGAPEFERIVQEDGTIVRLIDRNGSVFDDVIREGESDYTYRCTKCGTILKDTNVSN